MYWLAIVLATVAQLATSAEQRWLSVVATDASVEKVVNRVKELRLPRDTVKVVASDDCSNLKPGVFLAVTGISSDRAAAERRVREARGRVPDSYVRACEPKTASRVQFGISAVDTSIFDVPGSSVNWADEDRISVVRRAGSVYVLLRRRYEKVGNDPLEGRRTTVILFTSDPATGRELMSDCTDANVVSSDRFLALTCARENAGDVLLHEVTVFDLASGRSVHAIAHCRDPKLTGSREIVCDSEAVSADGVLVLKKKRLSLD